MLFTSKDKDDLKLIWVCLSTARTILIKNVTKTQETQKKKKKDCDLQLNKQDLSACEAYLSVYFILARLLRLDWKHKRELVAL